MKYMLAVIDPPASKPATIQLDSGYAPTQPTSEVPEPCTLLLLTTGAFMLWRKEAQ